MTTSGSVTLDFSEVADATDNIVTSRSSRVTGVGDRMRNVDNDFIIIHSAADNIKFRITSTLDEDVDVTFEAFNPTDPDEPEGEGTWETLDNPGEATVAAGDSTPTVEDYTLVDFEYDDSGAVRGTRLRVSLDAASDPTEGEVTIAWSTERSLRPGN